MMEQVTFARGSHSHWITNPGRRKMKEKFEILFSPFAIKSLVLKNRLVMPPMGTSYATSFGSVTPRFISYHCERAAGGVGINIVEFTSVESKGRLNPHMLGIWDDSQIPGLKSLAEAVHQAGGKIGIQIGHAGRRARSSIHGGRRPWAPSPIPELGGETPYEMSQSQIDYLQACFEKAARRAKQAGFDAVELHTAHGYLIHQFLSPLSNNRSDRYGGSLENRSRFALETLARIREGVGGEFPIFCRISGNEFVEGGSSLAEAKLFAKFLEKGGADVIDVSAGVLESAERTVPPMAVEHGCNVGLAEEIKRHINLPVICVGRIKTPEEAEQILQKKSADLIAMGRALIADPELPRKARAGGDIRPCIGCNQGCIDRLYNGLPITCLVNARVGREFQIPSLGKAPNSKKIAVIGGGPAGLEFARVASKRGHRVTLYEKEKELGGRFRIASIPPKRTEINEFVEYLIRSIRSLGVKTEMGVSVEPEDLAKLGDFDEVVVAVGGVPISFPMPEMPSNVSFAEDVLQKKAPLGAKIVVIGGGMVGCETAEWIAESGRQVTLLEQLPEIAGDMESRTRKLMLSRLDSNRVEILCNGVVERVEKDRVIYRQGGLRFEIGGVDHIVLALGYKANDFNPQIPSAKIHRIGDCLRPRKAIEAVHEGFLLGVEI
jgi:2,4-dienoyl-CoA reductase-like NADH-dependent reductase (Old Yellow Enzyme family)/thioredoxin reductase